MAWKAGSQTGKKVTARKDIWLMMQEALLAPSIGESMGRTKKQLTGGTCPSLLLIDKQKKVRVASPKSKVQQRMNCKKITNLSCGSSKWTSSFKKEV